MRVDAFLFVRNEAPVLGRTLAHLAEQGIEVCLVDHGSTDDTHEIAQSFLGKGVYRIESEPYDGVYDRVRLLERIEELARESSADWCLLQDADEIREPPAPFQTLVEALEAVGREGYNAVNFDEFVFLPTSDEESFEGTDFVESMQHYYFFRPKPFHRLQAWKRAAAPDLDLVRFAGHRADFQERVVSPVPFVMRHYIALSRTHAMAKYAGRVHAVENVRSGWHGQRAYVEPSDLHFPPRERLKRKTPTDEWDRSDPWTRHEFLGPVHRTKTHRVPVPDGGEAPVPFVVGVSRSGTTLLRLMLDAHPELAIPPETHFVPTLRDLDAEGRTLRERFLQKVVGTHVWAEFRLSAEALSRELEEIEPFNVSAGIRAFYGAYARRFGKSRFGDKTPGYVVSMTAIRELLPEARFIHLIRDGRDVALSLREMTWFGPGSDLVDQAGHWASRVRMARQQAQELPHYLEVRYEDLVRDPPAVLRQICEFIELPYDRAMEDPSSRAAERLEELGDREYSWREVLVPRQRILRSHSSVLRPPDPSKIGRWRTGMSGEERRAFEGVAGALLRDLGYETPPIEDDGDEAARLRLRLAEARRQVEEHRQGLADLERRLFEGRHVARRQETTIAKLRRRIDRLTGRSDALQKEVHRLRRGLSRRQELLDAMSATRTWHLRTRVRRILGID